MLSNLNKTRLAKVHPILAEKVAAMIQAAEAKNVAILVTQTLRTVEEQDDLYAKGRTVPPLGPKYIVTKAKGGQSYHNFGLAVDIVILDSIGKADWDTKNPGWSVAAECGIAEGLEWGGNWRTFKDLPHFQYTGGLTLATCRDLYKKGGLSAVWAQVK